jgi:hypothetical protein
MRRAILIAALVGAALTVSDVVAGARGNATSPGSTSVQAGPAVRRAVRCGADDASAVLTRAVRESRRSHRRGDAVTVDLDEIVER